MSKTVIFVGLVQSAFLDYLKKKDYTVGLFFDKKDYDFVKSKVDFEKVDFAFAIDFQTSKSVKQDLHNIIFKEDVLFLALYDQYILPKSYILDHLKTNQNKFLSLDLAKKATNKLLQRKAVEEKYPKISPKFQKIRTFHQAYTFSRKYGFPLVVKPANLTQSRLVYLCNDLEDLIKNASYVLDKTGEIYRENHIYRLPQVIIEEFIQGKQFSIDSYVDEEGKIIHTPPCRQLIGKDFGYDNFETMCSFYEDNELTDEEKTKLFETVGKVVESLGIKKSPIHTELKIDKSGECKLIEINMRNGGMRNVLLKLSYNINHVENCVNTVLGKNVKVQTELKQYSSAVQFWSEKEGVLKSVKGLNKIKKLKSYKYISQEPIVGEKVGPAILGYKRILTVIMTNKDKNQLLEDAKVFRSLVELEVEE